MKGLNDYRPPHVEFDIEHDGTMPETFGEFADAKAASQYIADHLVAINQGVTVSRFMDAKEKKQLREEYNNILEQLVPTLEAKLADKLKELSEAKKAEKEATEQVNAANTAARDLARDVRRGTKDMKLDELFTWRIPYKGRYYFYTYIDGQLRLCKERDILEKERAELYTTMADNEDFIDTNFTVAD